jgi:CDP-glucose 4,6-dehydratase
MKEITNLKNILNHSFHGNVNDYKKLKKYINKVKPEIIFHLAAQSLVKKSYDETINTFNTNIMGTVNLLQIVKNLNYVRSIVLITSDKCYKNLEKKIGYKESDILSGVDPYSASKACAEIVIYSYIKSFFEKNKKLGVASVRAGNVIGGGDWSENRIIPDTIKSIIKKNKIIVRSPNSIRPWQHVLDPLNGYLLLAYKLYGNPKRFSGAWNFGPHVSKNYNVKKVVKSLLHFMNIKKKVFIKRNIKFKETNILILNCKKSKNYLNWKPKWSVKKSIEMTAQWYKEYVSNKKNIKNLAFDQIGEFFK